MFWLGILIVAAIVLIPSLMGLRRVRHRVDARDSALALYKGQLTELDRDRTIGLLNGEEFDAARLEIQRRLLAADEAAADPELKTATGRSLTPLIGIALLIPLAAFGLYIVNGHPSLPPQPLSERHTTPDPKALEMIRKLQAEVTSMAATDPNYAMGHMLLGQVEEREGLTQDAIKDWKAALEAHFTPELAIRLAELQSQQLGHISPESLELYRRALAEAPPNAPWRMAVEARIAVGEHQENNGQ
ncbi:c-type cytochrome biogenesis protein CcmI [Gluconobacter wancherniae]|uniref:c-type cytochrome biogenesis protein CcmI n=1 Tax=Gluconobacter wancherniae TaxID=1307955 RepID=UPI001B8D7BF7|nr:c-type cytochrome biogenesis protein CcmI [Gluconobacter wancherniae]MBS1061957.1 c-type cytochrome biogenesis protein CcmI [Gluconobacter wancherniae]MBS1093269.1 c-type cytochrome biogenesis protein CcmI [Gluconobacter wancherniae]